MRLIDADALIEKYTVVIRKAADEKLKTEIAVLLKDIEEQPTVEAEPQWIPCSEREPDKDGDYLVTSVYYDYWNDQKYISIDVEAYYTRNGTEEYGTCLAYKGWQGGEKVIAWMPLPEPYKDPNNDD